jgi:hypothetical protein
VTHYTEKTNNNFETAPQAPLVVDTIEQLGINTHKAFTRNMEEEEP